MRRLLIPVGMSLAASCLVEFIIECTGFFQDDRILWDTLFRTIAVVPGLMYWYREDQKLRGNKNCGFQTGSLLLICGMVLSVGFRILFAWFGIQEYESATEKLFDGNIVLQCLVLLIASPVLEELFFRGVFYQRLKEVVSIRSAMMISAFCFGLYHGNISQGIYGFVMGLFLAWAMEHCRTVAAPLTIHIGANVAAVFLEQVFV